MNLLLRNSHIISPAQNINGKFDILILNGVINKMGVVWQHVRELVEYDMTGNIIIPGLFDMHVHFRDPGQTHKEDLMSGSEAAAYGGFTGVLCMPNTEPPIDTKELILSNKDKTKDNITEVFYSACASSGREGTEIYDYEKVIDAGALAVTDDGNPVESEELMIKVLKSSAEHNIPFMQHCEIISITDGGVINEGEVSRDLKMRGIKNESEYKIIERDLKLLKKYDKAHYHVQHLSTKESVKLIRQAKKEGLNVTAEACPHHFVLTDADVKKYGANAKMNPPLRSDLDVNYVLEGINDGTIDTICTDHAPHTSEEKSQGLDKAPFGIVGLETAFALSHTYLVKKNVISLEELILKMAVNPRKILGLKDIMIAEGNHANLTIIEPEKEWEIDINKFHSKSNNCPYHGWLVTGKQKGIINKEKILLYD